MKETLCKLREEVDVVLRRIDGAIKYVGLGGMGPEVRSLCITQVLNQKGKEVAGVGDKGLRSLRGFKPKKKVTLWKPKAGMGLALGQGFSGSESHRWMSWVRDLGTSTSVVEFDSGEGVCKEFLVEESNDEEGLPSQEGRLPAKVVGKTCEIAGGVGSSSESSSEAGFVVKGIIRGMGSLMDGGGLPISVVGVLIGEVGSPLQVGLSPAKVVEKYMMNTGGLGVSKKAGECFGEGGLAVKESSVDLGILVGSREMPMLVAVRIEGFVNNLGESEAAKCALRMPYGAIQCLEEELHCHEGPQMALTTWVIDDEGFSGCLDNELESGSPQRMPVGEVLSLGVDSNGYQGVTYGHLFLRRWIILRFLGFQGVGSR